MKKIFQLKTVEKILIIVSSIVFTTLVNVFDPKGVLLQILASAWSLLSFAVFLSMVPGTIRWLGRHVWPFTVK
jgi:hypothetical protein